MAEREEIEQVFRANLGRVRGLVTLHEEIAPARPGETVDDLLRAAVVLLHATLEDLLRSLAGWKLPEAPSGSLSKIKFHGSGEPRDKFDLGDLAEFRGRTVDEVIGRSINLHLEKSTYNHPGEIVEILKKIGSPCDVQTTQKNDLAALMSRRHQIAHRADRIPVSRTGRQAVQPISASDVGYWIEVVREVGTAILAAS